MSNQTPSSTSKIEIQTLHAPSKTRHPLFANVAAPNTTEEISGRRSVLILGLAIEGNTFWPEQIAKIESALCHLPIILYHEQAWEHWQWRIDRYEEADVVIPLWNKDSSNLLIKAIAKICLGITCTLILHLPKDRSDVEKDGNCVSVCTEQQLIDVTSAILENRQFEYSNKIYFGNRIEFDYAANDGTTDSEAETETVVNGYSTGLCPGLNNDTDNVRSPHSPDAPASSHGTPPLESVPPGREIQVGNPHTRSFQACNECRRRHIKCDLGRVDNPRAPPCASCCRENRNCTFSTRRKKRKGYGRRGRRSSKQRC
jgi:Zn(2)-Cys(6) binuclear cluster domain-containing protein